MCEQDKSVVMEGHERGKVLVMLFDTLLSLGLSCYGTRQVALTGALLLWC